jgi:hypothetical protein
MSSVLAALHTQMLEQQVHACWLGVPLVPLLSNEFMLLRSSMSLHCACAPHSHHHAITRKTL